MRVVLLNESPGADDRAHDFTRAVRTFNQGLDIRLRFLDVGFEVRHLPVRDGDESVATRVTRAPRLSRNRQGSRTAGCSAAVVTMWPPLSRFAK